ncbi:hypothetical protein [Chryseobacterium sp.]|uniref:hypothetical protein n=1 Tax=Chryseobacterium sp. TaxID=1871047 RepID=UPI00289FC7EC|nr:hypothetical protein [Chryseobacterium sp.]
MTKHIFKITLLENGLNSIIKGIEYLNNYESNSKDLFDLKHGITFFHNGVELLFKEILSNKFGDEEIIDKKDSKLNEKYRIAKEKCISVFDLDKPVKTITFTTALQKITNQLKLDNNLKILLEQLQSIRNSLEHYGINKELEKVETLFLKLKFPMIDWLIENGISIPEALTKKWISLQQHILKNVFQLRGSTFIKEVNFEERHLEFSYIADYKKFIEHNPLTKISEDHFISYWETGNAKIKALNDGCVRILRKNPDLYSVSIKLMDINDIYSISINRDEIERFLKADFLEIENNWDDIFSNKYVYTKEYSLTFFDYFGTRNTIV